MIKTDDLRRCSDLARYLWIIQVYDGTRGNAIMNNPQVNNGR